MRQSMFAWARPLVALRLLLIAAAVAAAGCTIQLAPNYEETIVGALNAYNTNIQTHIASVAEGTEKGLSDGERAAYDALKGQGQALIQLVQARPQPESSLSRWFGGSAADDADEDGALPPEGLLDVPTDNQIEAILEQIAAMQTSDETGGLHPREVEAYANAIASFMRNALTYEMALKR